jgi:protein TonB
MFEDALLQFSPHRNSALARIHCLLSALAGALAFALSLYAFPLLLMFPNRRALLMAAATAGGATTLYALVLCYVWADSRQQHRRAWPWVVLVLLLNLPAFLIYLVYSAHRSHDWKRAATSLAYVVELMLVGALILVPLVYTQALPRQWLITGLYIPPPPPGPPPTQRAGRPAAPSHRPAVDVFTAPVSIPPVVAVISESPEPPRVGDGPVGPIVPGVPSGFGPGTGYIPGGAPWEAATPPPPLPTPHAPARPQMVRRGGDVIAAMALYQPKPVYPPLAIMARIQGTVVLQAIIGTDGSVRNLKALSGHPLLVPAAIDAVKTWRYQPTLLNAEPVEVLTQIDVKFELTQ